MFKRVFPRDLFNEAKLLKCLGRLTLIIEDEMVPKCFSYHYDGEQLEVHQRQSDGGIYCANIQFFSKERGMLKLYTSLNSRESYPLVLDAKHDGEIEVFTDSGSLTDQFIMYIK